jgi:hypothetical protein
MSRLAVFSFTESFRVSASGGGGLFAGLKGRSQGAARGMLGILSRAGN